MHLSEGDMNKNALAWLLVVVLLVGTAWVIWVYLPEYCRQEHRSWLTECRGS